MPAKVQGFSNTIDYLILKFMGMKNYKKHALQSASRNNAINLVKTLAGGGKTAHNACNGLVINE